MSSEESKLAMAKTVLSTVGSIAATVMVARTVAKDYLPDEFQHYLSFGLKSFLNRFSTQMTAVIYEFNGILNNEIYDAAQLYLPTRVSPTNRRFTVNKARLHKSIDVTVEPNEEVTDVHDGVEFKWVQVSKKTPTREYYDHDGMSSSVRSDLRSFELTFHKNHKNRAFETYLPYVIEQANLMRESNKTLKLYTVDARNIYSSRPSVWTSVNLDHPATFATLAMEAGVKETVLKDLERFVRRREKYRKGGKAWKRGYLLYGPPGTGKSSLIAAMANHLKFNIYDLELTDLKSNSDLRRLLVATENRSILVVEDIDCSLELYDRVEGEALAKAQKKKKKKQRHPHYADEQKFTLSGFLNFIDGLWSSCGDERIIVFTANRKEKLDAALLRPGRMDVHIHMSYCTPCGFRLLASNYLGLQSHCLFGEIEDLLGPAEVTPAEVAEQLLKDDDPDAALEGLVEFLGSKRKEREEAKANKVKVDLDDKEEESEEEDDADKSD